MAIYVVVTVYAGIINSVEAFQDEDNAKQALIEAKKDLGIIEGQEEESEHAASLYETELK